MKNRCRLPATISIIVVAGITGTWWAGPALAKAGLGHGGGGWGSGGLGPGGVGGIVGITPVASSVPATTVTSQPSPTGGWTTTTTVPDTWVTMACTSCLAAGMVCLPDGQIGRIPPGSPLPPGDSVPFVQYLSGPVGDATPLYFCATAAVTTTTLPPPPVPTAVWAAAPLPLAEIRFNPSTDGLVQLPTWFWLDNDVAGQPFVLGPIMLDGYSLTVTARPVSYDWSFGDGQSATSQSASPPDGTGPSGISHTYTQKGIYDVSVSVTWEGSTTLTYQGQVVSQRDLGQYRQPAAVRPYQVQEVRSVLLGG